MRYRGRFAPSPTGALHFGSLTAALASYVAARQAGGDWLVRIEDVDRQRTVPGSAEAIIAMLRAFGFQWTESVASPIVRQSERTPLYTKALTQLLQSGAAYECSCSRAEIAAVAGTQTADGDEARYPGWCRAGVRDPTRPRAIRLRTPPGIVAFDDDMQGVVAIDVAEQVGDFVIRRRDGFFAYQLAVVVDDADQRITHVVRGADLLTSTPRQILLQRALGLPTPRYAHVPLATDANGVKLSKSAGAAAIDTDHPAVQLWRVLSFLRQNPPPELRESELTTIWTWAFEHFDPAALRGVSTQEVAVQA